MKYTLYLDESGDFDKDLEYAWKNECLVGGFLVKENAFQEKNAKFIRETALHHVYGDVKHFSTESIKTNHATEFDEHKKAEYTRVLLAEIKKYRDVEFVIFENYQKSRIINSTYTYINIMADGVVQLLAMLLAQNVKENVTLDVIAGFRKDMTIKNSASTTEGYIGKEECQSRIEERIALLRLRNPTICSKKLKVNFMFQDDKRNECLILCDTICNFYITRTSKVFLKTYQDETYASYLMKLFSPQYHFSLQGDMKRELVYSMISNQSYDNLLFNLFTGIISTEFEDIVFNAVTELSARTRSNVFRALACNIDTVLAELRDLKLSETILSNAEHFFHKLDKMGKGDALFNLDVKLYQLALYDHMGDLKRMEQLFDEVKGMLSRIVHQIEFFRYAYIFYTRYAVFLFDTFQIDKAESLLKKLITQFEAYELVLDEIMGISEDEMSNLSNEIKTHTSEDLAKAYGTLTMCNTYFLHKNERKFEDAILMSDKALMNFNSENGKLRHYQYRAWLLAEHGDFDSALELLNQSFQIDMVSGYTGLKDPFGLYHLSSIIRIAAERGENSDRLRDLLKRLKNRENAFLEKPFYPSVLVSANLGKAMRLIGGYDKQLIKKYYRNALMGDEEDTVMVCFFKLMVGIEYQGYLLETHDSDSIGEREKRMSEICSLQAEGLLDSMQKLLMEAKQILEGGNLEVMYRFGDLRQY